MVFRSNKFKIFICVIIVLSILSVIFVTIYAINSFNNIKVWERSSNHYLDEIIIFDEEKIVENTEESESTEYEVESDYEKDNEQANEKTITHNITEATDEKGLIEGKKEDELKKEDTDKIVEKEELCCTIEVSCDTILNNIDKLSKEKTELIPANGVILNKKEVYFKKGESVFDVLLRVMQESKIHMEFVKTPVNDSVYIEGINNIYEFDCGELSGWMYKVNDCFPNFGCGKYYLEKGDAIEIIYTCDLGRDIGGAYINQK